ncbi:hypothetical protein FKR81_06205 [Lentzea tibetensis]|uniref:Alginate lyase domain-containing protein n=1 Tax=Lentzea tibetensis TaxID=2591470 RepID=A0A563F0Q6_9PSEU|nr:alginate lyase family protein [Lentzea tibetensis]TWP53540.1 hypothetical protein FKR81_06205 [Lentzea tibetensis]
MKIGLVLVMIASLFTPVAHAEPRGFAHPGVFVSKPQLNLVKRKLALHAEPWASAFAAMKASSFASLAYVAKPRPVVECGPYSTPNLGCTEERDDAMAAYTHALLWYLTGDRAHAGKAIEIMDAYATTLVDHTNSNAPLQSSWAANSWARTGELIRYTHDGWDAERQARFTTMLRFVYLPEFINGDAQRNGNWELIMMAATSGVAVFLDDRPLFDRAVAIWRGRMPAYVYLTSDGPLPKPPPGSTYATREQIIKHWHGQTTFVDGLTQETCRDFGHAGWGLVAATHIAETARIQGMDLYREMRTRITKAYEFHAQFDLGAPAPEWLCGGTIKPGLNATLEVGYNHYVNRRWMHLPNTRELMESQRPAGFDFWRGWETLTHAENPYGSPV